MIIYLSVLFVWIFITISPIISSIKIVEAWNEAQEEVRINVQKDAYVIITKVNNYVNANDVKVFIYSFILCFLHTACYLTSPTIKMFCSGTYLYAFRLVILSRCKILSYQTHLSNFLSEHFPEIWNGSKLPAIMKPAPKHIKVASA